MAPFYSSVPVSACTIAGPWNWKVIISVSNYTCGLPAITCQNVYFHRKALWWYIKKRGLWKAENVTWCVFMNLFLINIYDLAGICWMLFLTRGTWRLCLLIHCQNIVMLMRATVSIVSAVLIRSLCIKMEKTLLTTDINLWSGTIYICLKTTFYMQNNFREATFCRLWLKMSF